MEAHDLMDSQPAAAARVPEAVFKYQSGGQAGDDLRKQLIPVEVA